MDGDSIIYGGLRGPRDLVPASTRYTERQRGGLITSWAEQLERTEKARYEEEIGRDTAARQRTSYAMRSSLTTRDARCDFECGNFDAPYQIYYSLQYILR